MKIIRETETYAKWIENLKDEQAKARIFIRIDRLALGNHSTQEADIKKARKIAKSYKEE